MAFEPIITFEGNLVADPDLRTTQNGHTVASLRIALNDARPEKNDGREVPAIYADASAWHELGEHAADSLAKGMRVIGKARIRESAAYTPRDGGVPRGTLRLDLIDIGPSLRWARASVSRAEPRQAGGYAGQAGGYAQQAPPAQQGGWGQNPAAQGGGWQAGEHGPQLGGHDDTPPF